MIFLKLLSSRQICLRTSTLVTHLYGIQCAKEEGQTGQRGNNAAYRRLIISKTVEYLIILEIAFRVLYITIRLDERDKSSLEGHLPFNPFFISALQLSTFLNFTILRCMSLFIPFALVLDHTVYFGMDYPFIVPTWEIMVANGKDFLMLNEQHFNESRLNLSFYREIWTSFDVKFSKPSLSSFPGLSSRLRAQMVLYSALADGVIACFNLILFVIIATLNLLLLQVLAAKLSVAQLTQATADMIIVSYYFWKCPREVLFAMHILYLYSFMTTAYMSELNRSLRIALSQSQLTMFKYRYLDYFYSEYRQLLNFAQYANRHVSSPLTLTTLITQLTLNVVFIGFLLLRQLYPGEQVMLFCIVCVQAIFSIMSCLELANCSESFNRSSELLFRAQMLLRPQLENEPLYKRALLTTVKLKLMVFYEQVCRQRGDEFRFTAGSLCKISRRSLYEFAFLYSSLVMYVVKMVQKGRL